MSRHSCVSVVMACFNAERFVREAVISVLTQTYPHLELLCIEDGSTDRTPEILSSLAQEDRRIRIFTEARNRGLSWALRRGFSEARGEYWTRLDADDVWGPTKLRRQVDFLEENPHLGFAFSRARVIDERGAPRPRHPLQRLFDLRFSEPELKQMLLQGNFLCASSFIGRRRHVEAALISTDLTSLVCNDYDAWLRLSAEAPFGVAEEVLVDYRVNQAGLSNRPVNKSYSSADRGSVLLRHLYRMEMELPFSESHSRQHAVVLSLHWAKNLLAGNKHFPPVRAKAYALGLRALGMSGQSREVARAVVSMFAPHYLTLAAYKIGLRYLQPETASSMKEIRGDFLRLFAKALFLVFSDTPPPWARLLEEWGVARSIVHTGGALEIPGGLEGRCNFIVLGAERKNEWNQWASQLPDFGILWLGSKNAQPREMSTVHASRALFASDKGKWIYSEAGAARFEPEAKWPSLSGRDREALWIFECLIAASHARKSPWPYSRRASIGSAA